MAAKQPERQQQTNLQEKSPADLLEEVLSQSPVKRFKAIDDFLQSRVDSLEELLPDAMKGQGARLAKRAIMTLNRNGSNYAEVTPASFIRCVLEAAELGLAIDGRLAHAVVYNNKHKGPDGKEVWSSDATLLLDYKGIVAVARRINLIADCWARIVYTNDEFAMSETDGQCHYSHTPSTGDPGKSIGCYAVVKLPSGQWRHEWMPDSEINKIRARSKSFSKGFGPWKTDESEMKKKTVLKRILKMYGDDPAFVRMLEIDDSDYDAEAARSEPQELPNGRKRIVSKARAADPLPVDVPKMEVIQEYEPENEDAKNMTMQLLDAIYEAESADAMLTIGRDIKSVESVIGKANHDEVMAAFQKKYKELGGK